MLVLVDLNGMILPDKTEYLTEPGPKPKLYSALTY